MQHLAPDNEVQPQDPATLEPWMNSEEDNPPSQGGTQKKKAANGLLGLTASTLADDSDPVLNKEETQAIKTLEREVMVLTGTATCCAQTHMLGMQLVQAAEQLVHVASRHTHTCKRRSVLSCQRQNRIEHVWVHGSRLLSRNSASHVVVASMPGLLSFNRWIARFLYLSQYLTCPFWTPIMVETKIGASVLVCAGIKHGVPVMTVL